MEKRTLKASHNISALSRQKDQMGSVLGQWVLQPRVQNPFWGCWTATLLNSADAFGRVIKVNMLVRVA